MAAVLGHDLIDWFCVRCCKLVASKEAVKNHVTNCSGAAKKNDGAKKRAGHRKAGLQPVEGTTRVACHICSSTAANEGNLRLHYKQIHGLIAYKRSKSVAKQGFRMFRTTLPDNMVIDSTLSGTRENQICQKKNRSVDTDTDNLVGDPCPLTANSAISPRLPALLTPTRTTRTRKNGKVDPSPNRIQSELPGPSAGEYGDSSDHSITNSPANGVMIKYEQEHSNQPSTDTSKSYVPISPVRVKLEPENGEDISEPTDQTRDSVDDDDDSDDELNSCAFKTSTNTKVWCML